jgi:probable HAF family extracellular repeat protein
MAEWMRRMVLPQVGPSLLAAGAVLIGLSCGGGDVTAPTTGSLEITTATSGSEPDIDGYAVTVDGGGAASIASNGSVRRDNLESGSHSVHLAGMAANCGVDGDNPRSVTVTPGGTATASFSISCDPTPPPTGTIEVTTATTGSQPDPDGYTVNLDGGAAHPIETNATITIAAVVPGGRSVALASLARNCSVEGDNPRQVTVIAGQGAIVNFAVSCVTVAPRSYRAIFLSEGAGEASAINSAGQIVGDFDGQAVLWQNGTITDIPTLGGDCCSIQVYDINSAGQVVGYGDEDDRFHAFLWENGTMTRLGDLGARHSFAFAINSAGQVVGELVSGDDEASAFIWENGVTTDLSGGGEEGSTSRFEIARDINSSGELVGSAGDRGVIWQKGVITDLGTLGGQRSVPYGINSAGHVVGTSRTSAGEEHAFLWKEGAMTDLGTLSGDYSMAEAINDAGQVVGYSKTSDGKTHAFVWQDGVMTDLGTLGGDISYAYDINSAGLVVGATASVPGAALRPTLWTPE